MAEIIQSAKQKIFIIWTFTKKVCCPCLRGWAPFSLSDPHFQCISCLADIISVPEHTETISIPGPLHGTHCLGCVTQNFSSCFFCILQISAGRCLVGLPALPCRVLGVTGRPHLNLMSTSGPLPLIFPHRERDVLFPGYTHLQRAQPIRWSHWILR